MTPIQAKKFFAQNDIRYVLAQFVDIHGVAKAKAVPVSHFEDILGDGAGFAGFAVWGLGQIARKDPAAVAALRSQLSHADAEVRAQALTGGEDDRPVVEGERRCVEPRDIEPARTPQPERRAHAVRRGERFSVGC